MTECLKQAAMGSIQQKIVMVGAFPPPVVGLATTNAAVRDHLRALGSEPLIINVAALSLKRSVVARLGRLPRVLQGLIRLYTMRGLSGATLYISVSGGLGQIYDVLFIAVARLRRMRVFARHCSFAYLDEPAWTNSMLTAIAGASAVHVVQCQGMADRLMGIYGAAHVIPISNAVLYPQDEIPVIRWRREIRTLGFLSNLSGEKGVFDFLNLIAAIADEKLPLRAKLAGPFQDAETERAVRVRLEKLHDIEYVGPVYGADKEEFLSSIDVLIFPTRYKDETEAKVNHEAMIRGIPIIAYGRGCIPEIVGMDCGKVIDPAEPFVSKALRQVKAWLDEPVVFEAASRAAAKRFEENYMQSEQRWKALLSDLTGNTKSSTGSLTNETEDSSS